MNREIRRRQKRQAQRLTSRPPRRSEPAKPGRFSPRLIAAIIGAVVLVAVLGFAATRLRGSSSRPGEAVLTCSSEEGGNDVNSGLCRQHLDPGLTYDKYTTNPPTSGPHGQDAAAWGAYAPGQSPFPAREDLVHNMEHGGVVIWYKPGEITADQVDELTRAVAGWVRDDRKKVVLYPYAEMDTPLALTAWAWIQKLDRYDLEAVQLFVDKLESQTAPAEERNIPFADPVVLPPGY